LQHPDKRKAGGHGPTLADEVEFLLPTPRTTDSHGIGHHGNGGQDLRTVIAYLPTPMASDGHRGSNTYARGNPTLRGAVQLMPTPRATDGTKGGPNQRGSSGDLMLPSAVQGNRWGDYALAIARWEMIMRADAPVPTEPGAAWHRWRRLIHDRRAGNNPRPAGMRGTLAPSEAAMRRVLAVALVEWMMGLPAGWVTGVDIPRNAKLRLLGNGVVPPQATAAVQYLLNRTEKHS
jgi:DNA (cytosine-5)-methyltransferase 1